MAPSNVTTRLAAARLLEQRPAPAVTDAPTPQDFRALLLTLTGIDLRRCPRCGALALYRYPLQLADLPLLPPPDTS